jgi:hypothetical protein
MQRSKVVLLGPQRLQPTLNLAVASLGVHGRIAAITAGWEEREAEDEELSAHLGGRTINLRLWERMADVARRDPELLAALRARNDSQREMHELYRLRLGHAMECGRELLRRELQSPDRELVAAETESELEAVRELDRFHLERSRAIHAEFTERHRPNERDAVARHRRELAAILHDVEAVCVAGGHVARLADHLRLFGVFELTPELPVIAWSAGSMALCDRIVLFHDRPPHGPGHAEVWDVGIGLFHGVIPLPHATKRLELADPLRVRMMARRFRPALCVALDPRTRLDWNGRRWRGAPGTLRLAESGSLAEVGAA